MPREAPYSSIHLEHMLKLSKLNVTILPASPAFYHHPKKIDDFGTYVVRVNEDTNQIFTIRGYLKSNSSNQSYGKCMNGIDPYRNYVLDKYSDKFLVADYNALITKKDKIGSKDKIYTYTDHFKFYDKNYNILLVDRNVSPSCCRGWVAAFWI